MGTRRRTGLLAVVVACATAAGCTGQPPAPSGPATPPSASGEAPPSEDPGAVEFAPGEFEHRWNGVTFHLSLHGSTGTLQVDNRSSARLGQPGLYAILGDGSRSDATIDGAAPVPGGERASFDVTFAEGVDETTVGLLVLLIGGNNWGALAPAPV